MPPVGYDLWFLDDPRQFAESLASGPADTVLLPPDVVILKAVYVPEGQVGDLTQARALFNAAADVYLLRPVVSSDGPPFRSALIYKSSGMAELARAVDSRTPGVYLTGTYAYRYQAVLMGGYAWNDEFDAGRPGFF